MHPSELQHIERERFPLSVCSRYRAPWKREYNAFFAGIMIGIIISSAIAWFALMVVHV